MRRVLDAGSFYDDDSGTIIDAGLLFEQGEEMGIVAIEMEAMTKMGLQKGVDVGAFADAGDLGRMKKLAAKQKGFCFAVDIDDYGWVLYKDGKAVGAYYFSSRGAWQAGYWLVAERKGFGADSFVVREGEKLEQVAEERGSCWDIAREFIEGR